MKFKTHIFRAIMSLVVLLLALFFATLQPAQAAVTCQANHPVREGQTKPYIAHTYGVRWREIAKANNMAPADKLVLGEWLCIPPAKTAKTTSGKQTVLPETDQNAQVIVNISAGRIYITLSKFTENRVYLVKVRDINEGIGGWSRLGYADVKKNTTNSFSYNVPQALRSVPVLNVCLKDQTSDELVCRRAVNP